jgi:hypothetical protein
MRRHAKDTTPVRPHSTANDPHQLGITPSRRGLGQVRRHEASHTRFIEEDLALEPVTVAPAEASPHSSETLTLD